MAWKRNLQINIWSLNSMKKMSNYLKSCTDEDILMMTENLFCKKIWNSNLFWINASIISMSLSLNAVHYFPLYVCSVKNKPPSLGRGGYFQNFLKFFTQKKTPPPPNDRRKFFLESFFIEKFFWKNFIWKFFIEIFFEWIIILINQLKIIFSTFHSSLTFKSFLWLSSWVILIKP